MIIVQNRRTKKKPGEAQTSTPADRNEALAANCDQDRNLVLDYPPVNLRKNCRQRAGCRVLTSAWMRVVVNAEQWPCPSARLKPTWASPPTLHGQFRGGKGVLA